MRRLLFNGDRSSPFVALDFQILRGYYDIVPFHYRGRTDLFRLGRLLKRADGVLSWFADTHAFAATALAKALHRKSIVIVGGYEVAREPSIDYGLQVLSGIGGWVRRWQLRWTLGHADMVISGSEFSRRELLRIAAPRRLRVVLHGGIDGERFRPGGDKAAQVVTVASVKDQRSFQRKGIPQILQCARAMPDVPFRLLGDCSDAWALRIQEGAPSNLHFGGLVNPRRLVQEYQRSKVYLQLSVHEAFGIAVAEAMACECVPVVSDRGSLPEVVGGAGYVVPFDSIDHATAAITKALVDGETGGKARLRVLQNFPLSRRAKELTEAVEAAYAVGGAPR